MKSARYTIKLTVALLALVAVSIPGHACGPYADYIPSIDYLMYYSEENIDADKQENLRLWQSITGPDVPLDDINEIVYHCTCDRLYDLRYRVIKTDNKFINYIINTGKDEIFQFLTLAKELFEKREEFNSPWYYPADPSETYGETGDFARIIERCESNTFEYLADRYALQAIRAYFASRRYDECIEYFERHMASLPDSNLFKRMALGYVAGCWTRLGETDRANEMFAVAGDFRSLNTPDPVTYMAERNPDCPALMSHIHELSCDTAAMAAIKPVALSVINSRKCRNKGDWYYLLAYISDTYDHRPATAMHYTNLALSSRFSNKDNRDMVRVFRMKLDADRGDMSRLLDDLRWLCRNYKLTSPCYFAPEFLQNILCGIWLPRLMRDGDYTTAILMTGFTDRYPFLTNYTDRLINGTRLFDSPIYDGTPNYTDYCSRQFQLMNSLTSGQLIKVKNEINDSNPLWDFMRPYARTDADYLNELIGTLALREERYSRAARYLSAVSPNYQKMLNIYQDGYLSRDPFSVDPYAEHLETPWNAKLNFARSMQRLQYDRTHATTADRRAMAAIEYAMGLNNSFNDCWALTQYWKGEWVIFASFANQRDEDDEDYDEEERVGFLHKNDRTITEEEYRAMIDRAMAGFTTDEGRAAALRRIGRYRSAVRLYPHTTTAAAIRTSCDNWRHWQ